ncbi:topoisomerase I [Shewanella sp. VB17]|uniref:topoisomerase I n=1 Tax=Shewanella sp. VB17 TaxID=2739432 RepID=UPI0015648218|nr:topoisomerase I [Shewanella sp. VB17]NRD72649.1 topoisomerase I [Shewanella sp. VB17]
MQLGKLRWVLVVLGAFLGGGYLFLFGVNIYQDNDDHKLVTTKDIFENYQASFLDELTLPVSNAQNISTDVEPLKANNWVSEPTNTFSNQLYDFIEAEDIKYVDTTNYPFTNETESKLSRLSKSGDILLFDNTEPDYLSSIGVSYMDIVADYFGTAGEGDALIATGVKGADGGIHYLVLPISNEGDHQIFLQDVKRAVFLFKAEKDKLNEVNIIESALPAASSS